MKEFPGYTRRIGKKGATFQELSGRAFQGRCSRCFQPYSGEKEVGVSNGNETTDYAGVGACRNGIVFLVLAPNWGSAEELAGRWAAASVASTTGGRRGDPPPEAAPRHLAGFFDQFQGVHGSVVYPRNEVQCDITIGIRFESVELFEQRFMAGFAEDIEILQ